MKGLGTGPGSNYSHGYGECSHGCQNVGHMVRSTTQATCYTHFFQASDDSRLVAKGVYCEGGCQGGYCEGRGLPLGPGWPFLGALKGY